MSQATPFRRVLGPPDAPTEVWAIQTMGYEEERPVARLALWIDEVASGVGIMRIHPDTAALADRLCGATKGLTVAIPHDLLNRGQVLRAGAHALSLGVELALCVFPPQALPPGPSAPEESWLRWQFTLPVSDAFHFSHAEALVRDFSLFPLRFVSAPYVEDGRAFAYTPAALLRAASPPAGRAVSFVLSPAEDWTAAEHLLVALVWSRREPTWVVAATLADATLDQADGIGRLTALSQHLLEAHAASGGLLHALGPLVWQNTRAVESWNTGRRDLSGLTRVAGAGPERIDLEAFPTHGHCVAGVDFNATAMMWLGPAWHAAIPDARLASFAACEENRALGPGRRLIRLADPRGASGAIAARQWSFRGHVGLEEAVARVAAPVAPGAVRPAAAAAAPSTGPPASEAAALASRLALSKLGASAVPTAGARVRPSLRGKEAGDDAALRLRFAVRECQIAAQGLVARDSAGAGRQLAWAQIGALCVRQLPIDPPFESAVFCDVAASDGPPLRILAATRVNYAALPGGAAPLALENLRRLGRHVLGQNPAVTVDPETRAFLDGRAPAGFAGLGQFAAYDARYT